MDTQLSEQICASEQNRQSGGSGMAPPQIIISPPQPQQDNSLLSSFITSKMLNESNLLNSRTNMTAIEPTREQPSYFNARESIIPKLPATPTQQEIRQEVKPPPTPKQSNIQQEIKQLTPFEADLNQMKSGVISNFSTREKNDMKRIKTYLTKNLEKVLKKCIIQLML